MKNKVLLILLFFIIVFSFTGCSSKKEDNSINYLILVNSENKIPKDWEDNLELETAINAWDDEIKVEKETLKKYNELKAKLEEEGITIVLDSGFRSVKEQKEIWADFEKKYGIEYTKKTVAVPELSEHHTGLAIDICIIKDGKLIEENEDMIKEREIFAKIHEKLADYGFILRYPEGKDDITGYGYEPWHFRYIKDKKIAKEIMSNNLTYEEYLEKNK